MFYFFFNSNIMIMLLNCEFASPQVLRSRRSQTQRIGDVFPKYPPSEYARHHSPLAPRTPLTPAYVGRQMSQRDPHYLPGPPGMMRLDFIICWREQLTVSAPLIFFRWDQSFLQPASTSNGSRENLHFKRSVQFLFRAPQPSG